VPNPSSGPKKHHARFLALGIAVLALAIQLVPYGHQHSNPPVRQEPAWDSASTRDLAVRACFDCHSNESNWPWYSRIAPVSWLVQRDVNSGRRHLNFSEFDRPQRHARDAAQMVASGEMPMAIYPPLHPMARLSATEKDALVTGFRKTFAEPVHR
jgi:hypothetical protein